MVWCSRDGCYFCGRCYRDGCEPRHGTRPAIAKQYRMLGLACLFVFGAALIPYAGYLLVTPTPPGSAIENGVAAVVILLIFAGGTAWWGATMVLRSVRQREALRGLPDGLSAAFQEVRDPSLDWKPNHAAASRRSQTLWSAAALSALGGLALLVWSWTFPGPLALGSAVGLLCVLLALSATLAFVAILPFAVPSAVAVTSEGVHLWYDSQYAQRSQTDLMKWATLDRLGTEAPASGDPAFRLVRLLRIDSENAMDVYTAWQRHKDRKPF